MQVFIVFWLTIRILDPVPPLRSWCHFRRVFSSAELNFFGSLIWLSESMVICVSSVVTSFKWLTLLQREVKGADSNSTAYGTERSSVLCLQLIPNAQLFNLCLGLVILAPQWKVLEGVRRVCLAFSCQIIHLHWHRMLGLLLTTSSCHAVSQFPCTGAKRKRQIALCISSPERLSIWIGI